MTREIPEEGVEHVMLCVPNAKIEHRGSDRYLLIPQYDIATDRSWTEERRIIPPKDGPKFKPGDVLHHTETGKPFSIVDPFRAFLKLRRGPKADD